jgi:DMSO/TMAO reductase YedYZ molybdopterin-dependent catalytic subunit
MSEPKRSEPDAERAARYAALQAEAPVIAKREYARRSRRSVLTGGLASLGAFAGWRVLQNRPEAGNIPDLLREGHEFNEAVWRTLSREQATAPTFDRSASSILRVNGSIGLDTEIDIAGWQMTVQGRDGAVIGTHDLDDIQTLPKQEITVEHKCVEGWSHIVTWGGARFSDFAALYTEQLGGLPDYVSLATPNGRYFVGVDRASMLNSQAMLTYELEGEPLAVEHGAPLRLTTPNKYGIKQLKQIGTIRFTDERPDDYWAERGYDWYAQL